MACRSYALEVQIRREEVLLYSTREVISQTGGVDVIGEVISAVGRKFNASKLIGGPVDVWTFYGKHERDYIRKTFTEKGLGELFLVIRGFEVSVKLTARIELKLSLGAMDYE